MFARNLLLAVITAVFGIAVSGCGGGAQKPVKVSGVVTLEGEPLSGVIVVFNPMKGSASPASGKTDDKGEFDLTTKSFQDGAVPGEYKVTITSPEESGGENNDMKEFGQNPNNPEMLKKIQEARSRQSAKAAGTESGPIQDAKGIHQNYTRIDKTPITITVPPPEGKAKINLKKSGT